MLPQAYEFPAAVALLVGGALACFAGQRLFRIVLGIYGFIAGAMLASSVMGISSKAGMLVAALIGGILGSVILVFAYFVGVALIGAGLGAFIAHVVWGQTRTPDPPAMAVAGFALGGTIAALILQRYVIIVATAFSGAWTIIVGALALIGDRGLARAVSAADVWILYPFTPAPGDRWVPIAWLVLSLVGMAVQLGLTGRKR